ncbi:MAG: hypothetical protein VX427_13420 [Acidobacteriota bacterium]|nr:hypothetical protein [Acidobacteriota bacterium]
MFIIDQGTGQGPALGQRVAVFRPGATPDAPVTELGESVAVLTEAGSATIHLRRAHEPVKADDSVAIQRLSVLPPGFRLAPGTLEVGGDARLVLVGTSVCV